MEGWREITAQMEAEYAAPKRRDTGTKVSVIIPVYQAEQTLQECVLSVKQQSYADLEILLIDDGSTDEGGSLCDRLSQQDDRIKVFHEENRGVSAARNKGLREATGTYVMFVDADDVLLPGAIETLMKHETETKADLVAMLHVRGVTAPASTDYSGGSPQMISGYYYIDNCIFEKDTHVWGKLFYKPALEGIVFDETLTIGEDLLFLTQLALKFGSKLRIMLLPEAGYEYRENAQSAMHKPFTPSFADNLTCWERCEELIGEDCLKLSPYALTKLNVIKILNALLVTERIALLPEAEWDRYGAILEHARAMIKSSRNGAGVFAALTTKDKARLFYYMLNSRKYMRTYAARKKA